MSGRSRARGLLLCDAASAALRSYQKVRPNKSGKEGIPEIIRTVRACRDAIAAGRRVDMRRIVRAEAAIESVLDNFDGVQDRTLRGAGLYILDLLAELGRADMAVVEQAAAGRGISRRAQAATAVALRMLPPPDRPRYRAEFASELAGLPRVDQAPYAFRLALRALPLRWSLVGAQQIRPARLVITVTGSVVGGEALAATGWPTAVLGGFLIFGMMWIIADADRTRRLATLIKALRSERGRQARRP